MPNEWSQLGTVDKFGRFVGYLLWTLTRSCPPHSYLRGNFTVSAVFISLAEETQGVGATQKNKQT